MSNDFTIEFSHQYQRFSVYEFGVYGSNSVLAGQTKKSFKDQFKTLEEAQAAYPHADSGFRDPNNFVDHLPDRELTAREEEFWSDENPV